MKLAIIDIIGAPYDGSTPFKQGLGGSESAVVLMARELQKLGIDVTVFCNCDTDHAVEGTYDGVTYFPLVKLAFIIPPPYDVVISSRTVIPFTDPQDLLKLNDPRAMQFVDYNIYERIVRRAKVRALWMHDTFSLGDGMLEELAISNRITDIFTLSDFHLTYVANCAHGRKRNFEVLKQKMFITRNGATKYYDEVDITQKDKDLFVYNASVTKGMIPLVNDIWPLVKQQIPTAKLKVIGGYYKFQENSAPDKQSEDWLRMANDPVNKERGIEFTGIITQKEVADILVKANFMIYPAIFPETYGISIIEAMLYNVPVITCRFGAAEEVAIDEACYKIDYPVEPNGLFPEINKADQTIKFAELVVKAYNDPYLHQQKQYYCNIIKPIIGWDSVALQWKQFLVKKLGHYLPVIEYNTVSNINHRVNKIFKRRYQNVAELDSGKKWFEQEIHVISTFYNCEQYIEKCIQSIASQAYSNYTCTLIDDCSTDNTYEVATKTIESLPSHIRYKFSLIKTYVNNGAVFNQIVNIREQLIGPDTIIMLIDGDDSLINDNTVFSYYNNIYDSQTDFAYGSCWSEVDNIPLISQPYPEEIRKNKSYRQHKFNWGLPYTHLRTFRKHLIDRCTDDMFVDENGNWFKAGGDGAVFYALIEAANPNKIKVVQDVVYNYNDRNPLNDYKVNAAEQNKNAKAITMMAKKKILIAIPTARNIEAETFKSIYDLIIPDGYEATFQYFYGYNVDQVRNLIADWTVKGFDYLFAVDSDISFANDTLIKLLNHDKDIVSGLYVQRKPGLHILEVYEHNDIGGVSNIDYQQIKGKGLVPIASCGFGCVLIKSEVFKQVGYPYFVYHSAIDHQHTISEDIDFCRKALAKGFKIWADTDVLCNHTGSWTFRVGQ